MMPARLQQPDNDTERFLEHVEELTSSICEEIRDQYLEDSTPWVVGFSGGKDSTAVLQLIFYALSQLPNSQLTKEVHVLSNDTLVENPNIVGFLDKQLAEIERIGKSELFAHAPDLFKVIKVTPRLEDTFWLNLIGKGYPSPNRWFRWCTERMKINPTSDYILKTVSKYGTAIIVLGTRKTESANRAKSMRRYEIQGLRLRAHSLSSNAYVFAPIAEMTTQEVWTYLINTQNPWKVDNQELLNVYRSASDVMECPLVLDDTTPSCGNSRFGCWVCTVVEEDKSMKKMIVNGEAWMLPLLDFRDWLRDLRNDASARDTRRRNGQPGMGPFTMQTRRKILEKLLQIEKEVGQKLITEEELIAIQFQWNYDGYFGKTVNSIVNSVNGGMFDMPENQIDERRKEEFNILDEVCLEKNVNAEHIKELLEVERSKMTFLRRHGLFDDLKTKIAAFAERAED